MVIANLGSLAVKVLDRVENVPSSISGAMIDIVDEQRIYVEQYTGQSVGSTAIAEKYQGAIIDLSTAQTLDYMQLTGVDASSISLGEFNINKGGASNLTEASRALHNMGMAKLKILGGTLRFSRSIGGT